MKIDRLIDWMLTFRDQVEVLEPENVRRKLMEIAERVTELYKKYKGELYYAKTEKQGRSADRSGGKL